MQGANWDDMRFVLAVARAGSYAEAARRLGVNESTVSRRIAGYEQRLSARLFERSDKLLVLTEAGAEVARRVEIIEREVQAAEGTLTGVDDRAAGVVRVSAAHIFTNHVLVPGLPRLLPAHPQLRIELIADGRDLSLIDREADVAVRLSRPDNASRAVVKQVGNLAYAVYAASSLADGASNARLPWIAYDDRSAELPQARWISEGIEAEQAPRPHLYINDAETLLRCLRLGLGKSVLPRIVGDSDRALACVAPASRPMVREVWVMIHPHLRKLTRIRTVVAWITELCRAMR